MQETTTNQTAHDPVCHMDIRIEDAAGSSDYEGKTYYFCAVGCKLDFDDDPEGVLKAEAEYDHNQPGEHGGMTMPPPVENAPPVSSSEMAATAEKKPWWQFWK